MRREQMNLFFEKKDESIPFESTFSASLDKYAFDFDSVLYSSRSLLLFADCLEWLKKCPESSIHAVVTDPPYGLKEYEAEQLEKKDSHSGGVWRIPPSFDGSQRNPLPRFTALNTKERDDIYQYFLEWGRFINKILLPGGHLFIASNSLLSPYIFGSIKDSGLEYRGSIVRLVTTFRGGDRPKGYEEEFPETCTLPRGNFEPWGLFRKALPQNMTVGECLRLYKTGGLRRPEKDKPFHDVIQSERTSSSEKQISDHPSLKPQSFMRQIVRASLPLGEGIVLDPFMGSGSTVAASEFLGYRAIGIEKNEGYFRKTSRWIQELSNFK